MTPMTKANDLMNLALKGGAITWLLLAISVVSLAFIIERALYLRQASKRQNNFQEALRKQLLLGSDPQKLRHFLEVYLTNNPYPFATLVNNLSQSFSRRSFGAESLSLETILSVSIQREAKQLERGLGVIGTIASIAPLLGLLGTVLGMIQAFLGSGSNGSTLGEEVTGGLSQALVTTALGLIVSIPGIVFHNTFSKKIDVIVGNLEACGIELASILLPKEANKSKPTQKEML